MKKYFSLLFCLTFNLSFLAAQNLYGTEQLTVIEITFAENNWDELLDQFHAAGAGERLPATVEINGQVFDGAGIRYRGGSTYDPGNAKNPMSIKLDYSANQNYQGYQVLKLNNGAKDPSWLREVMGFEILRNYMEAPLANYASVYVNGNFLGVYANVESINSKFFAERFLSDPDNPRFEADPDYGFDEIIPAPFGCNEGHGAALEYLGPNDLCYFSHYNMQSPAGWASLRQMTELLNSAPADVRQSLDLDRFIWMSVFNSLTANLDSYLGASPRNYFIFKTGNGHWVPVMTDLNEGFARFPWATIPGAGDPQPGLSFYTDLDPFLGIGDDEQPLLKTIFADPNTRRMYTAHLRTMMEEMFTSGYFENRAEELRNLIAAEVASDDNHFYDPADFDENFTATVIDAYDGEDAFGLLPLMDGRIQYLLGLPEFQAEPPLISGVSASPNIIPAGTPVTITATIENATLAWIGFRKNLTETFELMSMFDDGAHGDGASGDGVFGATLTAEVGGFQYYIYGENSGAGSFSPPRAEFEFYTLATSGEVVINEMMARNQSTVSDQDGEFDDWVEILNNSNGALTLTGWFLSDDPADPQKWEFPVGVFLDPGQRLTVWVDNDETQSGLHASFNLNGDGETILLTMPDGTVADQLVFGPQLPDISMGRCPDGTGTFVSMPPTFNTDNTPACVSPVSGFGEIDEVHVFPNPARDWVIIESNLERPVPARLVSPFGQTLMEFELGPSVDLEIGHLPSGIYFLEMEGQVVGKIVKR